MINNLFFLCYFKSFFILWLNFWLCIISCFNNRNSTNSLLKCMGCIFSSVEKLNYGNNKFTWNKYHSGILTGSRRSQDMIYIHSSLQCTIGYVTKIFIFKIPPISFHNIHLEMTFSWCWYFNTSINILPPNKIYIYLLVLAIKKNNPFLKIMSSLIGK